MAPGAIPRAVCRAVAYAIRRIGNQEADSSVGLFNETLGPSCVSSQLP